MKLFSSTLGLIIIISLHSLLLFGQDLAWKELKESDGLLSNYTYSILPSNEGYLWIGTENGLSVYDGYRISNFFPEDDSVMYMTPVYFLNQRSDLLWMATRKGVKIYSIKEKRLIDEIVGEERVTEDIYFLNDRKLLVTYYLGFYEIDLGDNGLPIQVTDHPLSQLVENGSAIVNEFYLDQNQQLYISVAGYGVLKGDVDKLDEWHLFESISNLEEGRFKQCLTIQRNTNGNLLFTFIDEGIFEYDLNTGILKPFLDFSYLNVEFLPIVSVTQADSKLAISQYGKGIFYGDLDQYKNGTPQLFDLSFLHDFNQLSNQRQ